MLDISYRGYAFPYLMLLLVGRMIITHSMIILAQLARKDLGQLIRLAGEMTRQSRAMRKAYLTILPSTRPSVFPSNLVVWRLLFLDHWPQRINKAMQSDGGLYSQKRFSSLALKLKDLDPLLSWNRLPMRRSSTTTAYKTILVLKMAHKLV